MLLQQMKAYHFLLPHNKTCQNNQCPTIIDWTFGAFDVQNHTRKEVGYSSSGTFRKVWEKCMMKFKSTLHHCFPPKLTEWQVLGTLLIGVALLLLRFMVFVRNTVISSNFLA